MTVLMAVLFRAQTGSKRPNLPASVVYKVSCEHFSQPLLEARPLQHPALLYIPSLLVLWLTVMYSCTPHIVCVIPAHQLLSCGGFGGFASHFQQQVQEAYTCMW